MEVSFESVDSNLAARVANALVKNYVESNFRSKYETTRQASAWMEQQLDELKAKVEKAQQALVDYEREYSIANLGDKENVVQERLAQLSTDLTAAQVERANKQSVYDSVRSNSAEAADRCRRRPAGAVGLEKRRTPHRVCRGHFSIWSELPQSQGTPQSDQRSRIAHRARAQAVIERIGSDYRTAVRREELLSQEVVQQKQEVEKLNQLLIQYTILKGEFETNQQLYDELLKRLKDATVSVSLRATNVRLADEALVPTTPIRPDKRVDIAVGLLVGLILGVTLAFVRERLDRTVKTAEDIEIQNSSSHFSRDPAGNKIPRTVWRVFRSRGSRKRQEMETWDWPLSTRPGRKWRNLSGCCGPRFCSPVPRSRRKYCWLRVRIPVKGRPSRRLTWLWRWPSVAAVSC